jgi:hypothetical protein
MTYTSVIACYCKNHTKHVNKLCGLNTDYCNAVQDRQCAYSLALRCVRATIAAVGKQQALHILSVCVCVCILALDIPYVNSIFVTVVLYCHTWPIYFNHIFPHLIKGTIFREQFFEYEMRILILSKHLSGTFLILIRIQRNIFINVNTSSRNYRKYPKYRKYHKYLSTLST